MNDRGLYAELSRSADSATENYLCPLTWDRLIFSWLSPKEQTRDMLRAFSLTDRRYDLEGTRALASKAEAARARPTRRARERLSAHGTSGVPSASSAT